MKAEKALTFTVILLPQPEGGFTVRVPALREVVTEGDSVEEALANASEAIQLVLEYRREHGIEVEDDPQPEVHLVTVAA